MNKTKRTETERKIMVDITDLQGMLSTGRNTADQIGTAAGAVVRIGRRKLYRVDKVEAYINKLSNSAEAEV